MNMHLRFQLTLKACQEGAEQPLHALQPTPTHLALQICIDSRQLRF